MARFDQARFTDAAAHWVANMPLGADAETSGAVADVKAQCAVFAAAVGADTDLGKAFTALATLRDSIARRFLSLLVVPMRAAAEAEAKRVAAAAAQAAKRSARKGGKAA